MYCTPNSPGLLDNLALGIPGLSLPAGGEEPPQVKPGHGMALRVKDNLVQGQQVVGREEQIEILERLGL